MHWILRIACYRLTLLFATVMMWGFIIYIAGPLGFAPIIFFTLFAIHWIFGDIPEQLPALKPPSKPKKPDVTPPANRPKVAPMPFFDPIGGALPTTAEAVTEHLKGKELTIDIGGAKIPVIRFWTRFVFIAGKAGTGKTSLMLSAMRQLAPLFDPEVAQSAGLKGYRWFIAGTTKPILPFVDKVLPPGVEIVNVTPTDIGSYRWEFAVEVRDDPDLGHKIVDAVFTEALSKSQDQFWVQKAKAFAYMALMALCEKEGDFTLADFIRLFLYPESLWPLLAQSKRFASTANHDLVDKMGQGIKATASGVLNDLAAAAAAMEHATKTFTFSGPDGFLNKNAVMYLGFPPKSTSAMGTYAAVLARAMTLIAMDTKTENDVTSLWADEGRYLSDFPVEEICARGRQNGLNVILSSIGIEALMNKWGEKRAKEILENLITVIAFSCGDTTAKAISNIIGDTVGIEHSWNQSENQNTGTNDGVTYSDRCSSNFSNSRGYGQSAGENFAPRTRPLITPSEITNLPSANSDKDALNFIVFNNDFGTFRATDVPFLHTFKDLPPSLFDNIPERPPEQRILHPFTEEDIVRLGFNVHDPDLREALGFDLS